ncbi:hypothetical protein Pst134EA_032606 [Puccinia striiformis f. sp. tritici]|uniref:uncharacterized protein n=1 Tax=Puccinia striiformis f. sp. tritici TaxID=168172 RepID=UPI0020073E8D|nr:uncharacterized protein Pst134EA_032606 [Puccinia striiformis f. sp. tritici]KAH9441701.1 hypothetical protein Pst134EA_032606 [Puccinia striiformis f. sp. tritici]
MDDPVKEIIIITLLSSNFYLYNQPGFVHECARKTACYRIPVKLPEVVRKITEPYEATEIVRNVNKYFTEDAYLLYPMVNQPYTKQGKKKLIGLYKLFRVLTINNQIEFHAVMFSEDKLKAAIELTETLQGRFITIWFRLRFISRVDLRKEKDGKYRICKTDIQVLSPPDPYITNQKTDFFPLSRNPSIQ